MKKQKILSDVEYYQNKIIEIIYQFNDVYWLKAIYAYIKKLSE